MTTNPTGVRPQGRLPSNEHRRALEPLLAFDPRIRCVVEIRFSGEVVASTRRRGLESLEPESETVRVLNQSAIGAGMGSSMNGYHGRVKVVIVVRERVSLIVFPLVDSLILLSADPDFPLQETNQIAKVLDTTFPCDFAEVEAVAAEKCPPKNGMFKGKFP